MDTANDWDQTTRELFLRHFLASTAVLESFTTSLGNRQRNSVGCGHVHIGTRYPAIAKEQLKRPLYSEPELHKSAFKTHVPAGK